MDENELQEKLAARFKELPKPVQNAITSADVEKHMRELADTQKLHLDQWDALENEVMLALLGFQPVEDLEKNIKSEVGVSDDVAKELATQVSKIVFEPIRGELERQLSHPQAKAVEVSGVEQAAKDAIQAETAPAAPPNVAAPVAPATPPTPPNEQKSTREPVSATYQSGETSASRKDIHEDPYRESPL